MFGFFNVNKPSSLTSHDVVNRVRRMLRERDLKHVKVGHAGTLDPMATGILILCLGAATRLSEYVMGHRKTYTAAVQFGVETDTYDAEGEAVSIADASHLTRDVIERALPDFLGEIAQVPPMYSAIKQGGQKLYDIARAGKIVEREARAVTVYGIELTGFLPHPPDHPSAIITVECSAGTYIRSLAHDLGAALGVGAHLTTLERTRSGPFDVTRSVTLEQVDGARDWSPYLIAPEAALADMPAVALDDAAWDEISHGRVIQTSTADGTLARGMYHDRFAAVLRAESGQWKPHKVFLAAENN